MKTHRWGWFDRFWAIAGAVSIRAKILGIVLGLVVMLGLGVTVQVRAALTREMTAQLTDQGISVARDLAARSADLILINDQYALHQLLHETQANNLNVRYAFIVDGQGQILAHTFGEGFPGGLLGSNTATPAAHHSTTILSTDEGQVWDTAVPILDGRAGTARVGLSEASIRQAIQNVTGQLLLTTVFVSVLGITAAAVLTWVLTRPVIQLARAAQAVGQGDFQQHVDRWADDELGDLAVSFNKMTSDLARAEDARAERDALRARYVSGVITAQEDERKRIARELHDSTSQALTSLLVGLKGLAGQCDHAEVQQRAEELRAVTAQTLDEVHALARQLRPSVLDDLGLPAALERYGVDWQRRYQVPVDLAVNGLDQRLPPAVETALYRIVQESLSNVARHAHAQTVSVLVERRNDAVRAIIEDDGQGFDPAVAGRAEQRLGLYGIRERAELLGGTLTIESHAGHGSSLFIEIPLPAVEPAYA